MKMNLGEIARLCEHFFQGTLTATERDALQKHLLSLDASSRSALSKYSALTSAVLFAAESIPPKPELKKRILSEIGRTSDEDAMSGLFVEDVPYMFMRSHEGEWASVAAGVTCKVLFHDQNEKRTTMLLKLEAGSDFPAHAHGAAEELFVLEGRCSCAGRQLETGDYHRAEGGTEHDVISTDDGCLMLVVAPKIEHLDRPTKESSFFFLHADEGAWTTAGQGISTKILFEDKERNTTSMLLKLEPGSVFPGHHHDGDEDLFVLEGDCVCAGQFVRRGDYHRAQAQSEHSVITTEGGCLMFVVAPEIHFHG